MPPEQLDKSGKSIKKQEIMAEELNVSIDFLEEKGLAKYSDGDIVIMEGRHHPEMEISVRLDMVTIINIEKGSISVELNNNTVEAHAGQLLVFPPNAYISGGTTSEDYESKIMGLSYSALQNNLLIGKDIWNIMGYIFRNPVIELSQENHDMLVYYHELMHYKLEHQHGYYDKEIMQSLFNSAFYELAAVVAPQVEDIQGYEQLRQGEVLFKRFIRLLIQNKTNERSVKYFAERLCVTPKYLSTVCKSVSDKTALEWIHDYLAEGITRKLKYTDTSIKEIADEMGFPNISFFGKFVKNRFGFSPKEYRKKLQSGEIQ